MEKTRCPLCGGPLNRSSNRFRRWLENPDQKLVSAVTERNPQWRPSHGLCDPCFLKYQERLELLPDENEG